MAPASARRRGLGKVPRLGVLALLLAAPAAAQPVTGYLQTVGLAGSRDGLLQSFHRLRLASEAEAGAFRIEAAYEQILTLRRSVAPAGFGLGTVPGGGEWLPLQGSLAEGEHAHWRHRFDRLQLTWEPSDRLEIAAGRQAVSWGTTLFLTPADPFRPFSPVDPFREFRAGVDAVRLRFYPGPLSEVDAVVSRSEGPDGPETTALVRGLTTVSGWELSGWTGALYGDPAAAGGLAGGIGAWALRGEGVLRGLDGRTVFRGTLGVDRRFDLADRDLTVLVEYQHDGLGAAGPEDFSTVLRSPTFARGEHQTLGEDEAVVQASIQLHPLWTLSSLALVNLRDRSAVIGPGLGFSAGDNATAAAGVFFGLGDDRRRPDRPLGSEFGLAGFTGYLSLSWYF